MRCKRYKENIILHLYGELSEQETVDLKTHLSTCPDCAREFEYTREVFATLDEIHPHTVPESSTAKNWAAVRRGIETQHSQSRPRSIMPRWAFAGAAMMLVFVLGIFLGRQWLSHDIQTASRQDTGEKYLQYKLRQHIDDLKPIVVEYSNITPGESGKDTVLLDREAARSLLIQNLLLRKLLAQSDPSAAQLLDDVDLVLKEIANLSSEDTDTPVSIQRLIQDRDILFKMDVLQKI